MEFLDERFWLAVCFVIFVCLAYRPVKKAILNSLDAKIQAIKLYLTEAENLKNEAEILLQKTQKQILKFKDLKGEILGNAQSEVDNLITSRNKEIAKLIERREKDALTNIKLKQDQAMKEVQAELIDNVTKVVATYFTNLKDESSDLDIAKNINGKKDLSIK